MPRPVLIIAYYFPPYPGVGGRRWAKFAKYLSRRGTEVHVLCARNPFPEVSPWTGDVEGNPKLTVHPIPSLYPRNLLREPGTFAGRALYRATGVALGWLTPGAMFDPGVLWRFLFVSRAVRLIETHGIATVIATGSPFHVLLHGLELKHRAPNIRYLADLRDPWSDAKRYRDGLPERRLRYEQDAERRVLETSDFVLAPSEWMIDTLAPRSTGDRSKFVTIPNGFDPEDLPAVERPKREGRDEIRVMYAGSLESEDERTVRDFLGAAGRQTRIRLLFIGSGSGKYRSLGNDRIRFVGEKNKEELFHEMRNADYGLIFGRSDPAYTKIVKFFEYVGMRKKILAVSPEPSFGRYLEENGIGIGWDPGRWMQRHDAGEWEFNPGFDVTPFSLPRLTEQLEGLLL